MNLRSASVAPRADVKSPSAARPSSPEPRELTGPQPTAAAPVSEAAPKRRGRILPWLVGVVVLGGVAGYFYQQRGIESTDDAQIDADVVSVPARSAGTVRSVSFEDNQQVEAGQLLAELDDAPARARFAQAQANLSAARAAAHAAELQAALSQTNAKSGLAAASAGLRSSNVSAQTSVAQIAEAQARLENAKAKLAEADLNMNRT
ncbi:MAG TPA: biotin/lipoyl-binding protein, partial [Polyangiales bacterium]|nr:biotin/lipoyl-binding protein [Polyangiales bacterium]